MKRVCVTKETIFRRAEEKNSIKNKVRGTRQRKNMVKQKSDRVRKSLQLQPWLPEGGGEAKPFTIR
jgi:hypothetical protein